MHAMILAAGFGTRLLPLTRRRPKCLMPVMNRPLLGLWLERLTPVCGQVVVNTHHLAPMVRDFLAQVQAPGPRPLESFEPEILGTGGALVAARRLLGDGPFLLANADVVCTADPAGLLKGLDSPETAAVLGLCDDARFNTVALGRGGRVLGFAGDAGIAGAERMLTYTGLAAISPRLLDYLPGQGRSSLVQGLRAALAAGLAVRGRMLPGYWNDLGSPEALWGLQRELFAAPPPGLEALAPPGPLLAAAGAVVEPGARMEGFCVLGEGARVESGARVRDSVLLPGARAAAGADVRRAILGDDFTARGRIEGGAHG